jgi:spore maturation protein CgeB
MKLLFVATLHHPPPGPLPPAFVDDPADPLFPDNQAHRFWVAALRRMGHTAAVFWRSAGVGFWRPRAGLRAGDGATLAGAVNRLSLGVPRLNPIARRRNAALLRAAASYRPDVVVLVGDNDVVLPATLATIHEAGARVVYASGTSPIVFSRAIERDAAPLYDLVVVNDASHAEQWRELGARRAVVLPLAAVDPVFHRPGETARRGRRVVFVGTLVPERLYAGRVRALEAIRGLGLEVWSVHDVPPSLAACHRGSALGTAMMDVLRQAAIVVNPHGDFMRHGVNMRLFEACGAGALQVTDERPAVRDCLVPGEQVVTYRTPTELAERVAYYLDHDDERRRIAGAGCRHVHAQHTYDRRMRRLMDLLAEAGE